MKESDCCGASEWLEDTGICSACKEHCDFIDDEEEIIDGIFKLPKVTRLEVIDHTGRAYVIKNANIELSYQDDARTLKIFVKPKQKS